MSDRELKAFVHETIELNNKIKEDFENFLEENTGSQFQISAASVARLVNVLSTNTSILKMLLDKPQTNEEETD